VALATSADGKWVLSQGAFHLHAWNVQTQSEQWRRDDVSPYCFAVRPNAPAAIIGNSRGELIEIDLESGQTLRNLGLAGDALLVIGLSADGDNLAVLRADGGLTLLDSRTGALHWETQPRRSRIAAGRIVSFSPCGTLLVTAGEEDSKSLSVWSVASGERIRELHGHENVVIGAAFADSGLLRSWSADGTIRTWNLKTGVATQVATIAPPSHVTS
jgi:WD40 repeat protein